jgi:hypothetical protein
VFPPPASKKLEDPECFLSAGLLEVPWKTRVDGEWLVYQRGDRERFDREPWMPKSVREALDAAAMRERGVWHYRAPSAKLLANFMEIAEAKDPQRAALLVKGFADRYGVLDLCPEHGLPASHNPGPRFFDRNNLPACKPYDPGTWEGRERIADWVRFARLARCVRDIAARLHSGKPGRAEDWRRVNELVPTMHFDERVVGRTTDEDWFHLRWIVNAWLAISMVTLTLRKVGRSNLLLRFDSSKTHGDLFGALGLQLLLRISTARGLAICSECGEPYEPRRRPDPTRDSFCIKHGHMASSRAKRRDRDAQREILRLSRASIHPQEIAKRLGTDVARVKRVIRRDRVT